MSAFLAEVESRFEGMEGYVVQALGFQKSDVQVMRQNLREA